MGVTALFSDTMRIEDTAVFENFRYFHVQIFTVFC